MKIRSRSSLSLTGLRYSARVQEYQVSFYNMLTRDGDLKYNLLYSLASEGRIKSDERLTSMFRTLITEIRLREGDIEKLESRIRELQNENEELKSANDGLRERLRDFQYGEEVYVRNRDRKLGGDDILDEDGKIPGYYGT